MTKKLLSEEAKRDSVYVYILLSFFAHISSEYRLYIRDVVLRRRYRTT